MEDLTQYEIEVIIYALGLLSSDGAKRPANKSMQKKAAQIMEKLI